MQINAAILWEQGQALSLETAELEAPHAGEVLVEVKAAGVCHSDLHPARGDWPAKTPLVLGHEGTGIVREVGAGVTKAGPGDHVVFCWATALWQVSLCLAGARLLCDSFGEDNVIATVCPVAAHDCERAARTWRTSMVPHALLITL